MIQRYSPRVAIAALRGGSGKTILSLGIIVALRNKGFKIVPFKKGPDYIDAGWLTLAAEHPCYNLDPFLMGKERVISSFQLRVDEGECAIIEGNRGLYDGTDEAGTYSTAELAKMLQTPLILVVDCSKVTRTVAAMILGCQKFDPAVDIRGIILNQIARSRHEAMVRSTVEHYCGLPVIGALPRVKEGRLPERHMGLTPHFEHQSSIDAAMAIGSMVEKYVDLDKLWEIAVQSPPLLVDEPVKERLSIKSYKQPSIGLIRDSAFQFYYPENLQELVKYGARLIDVSPLRDTQLPELDALYIGGGFPETHAELLAANKNFAGSLRARVEDGLPVYAECGGLIYLGRSISIDNTVYPMAGVLPVDFCLGKRPQGHGYTEMLVDKPNPYFACGSVLRGHEFHYSRVVAWEKNTGVYMAFSVNRGYGVDGERDGFCYKNVLATYTHLHALGIREWAGAVLRRALDYKRILTQSPLKLLASAVKV
ncbi:MAG TPA: cobyrinate a,c-diamide synthase [Proteobacteria bacterium]|nr:cobyrinate a,c-diamide synthase [Pseudomonadota bacterium]